MRKVSFFKVLSVLMALVLALTLVPTFSAEPAVTEETVTYATIDEFTCEISKGQITVTGYTGTKEKLTIPSELGGYTVNAIADNAFKGNTTLRSLTVSYEISKIGESAFEDCTNLSYVYINSDPIIGMNAFKNTSFYNDGSNWRSGLLMPTVNKNVLFAVKKDVEGVVYLPESVKSIAAGAFENCDKVVGIYIFDEAFVNIGDRAFADCDSLLGVKIPYMLNYIGNDIFSGSDKAQAYCVGEHPYIKSKCEKAGVPFNAMGMYSTYDEEWDITLTSYDDIWFTVEEVVYSQEDMNSISQNLSGAKINKACKVNTYNPYTSYDGYNYSNITLKSAVKGDALVNIYKNNGYKAYPHYFTSFQDGYGEFRYYKGDIIADIEFAYYSTTDEATNVTITLPTPFDVKSSVYTFRNEENDDRFTSNIDKRIPQGKSFAYVRVEPEKSEFVFNYPTHLGIKAVLPTNYGENVAYVYHLNLGFLPIHCKTVDGFAEVYVPQNLPYEAGVVVAGIEGTEITEPTEPTEITEPTKPATSDSAVTEPTEPTKFSEPSTNDSQSTHPAEKTEPSERTTSAEDQTTPTETSPHKGDFLLGDVNRDGKLNIRDATLIQKYLAKMVTFDEEQMIIADITLDKKVNIKDATYIQKKIANII